VRLVFGIGNPGPEYEPTRHNLGFRVVDRLAAGAGLAQLPILDALGAVVDLAGSRALLVQPLTFVNRCGPLLASLLEQYEIALPDLLVVVDDFQLPVGRLRLRAQGSSGGHNGLVSIIEALDSADFARLRLGIGDPGAAPLRDFVLSTFVPDEIPAVEASVERAAEAVATWARLGVERAMTEVNRRDLDQPRNRA
jgi:PTH1 family peptidyl-tRNA hydrolase